MRSLIPFNIFDEVKEYFGGDSKKSWEWLQKKNPELSFQSPLDLIKSGRKDKLLKFIQDQKFIKGRL